MKEVKILWTSGWDSTFRLLQMLSKLEKSGGATYKIQPVYVIDSGRPSLKIELEKMNEIRELIKIRFPKVYQNLKTTKFYEIGNIEFNEKISRAYTELKKESFMGSQYEWLGWLASELESLELCVHKDDKAHYFLKNYCKILEDKVYAIDNTKAPQNIVDVFGNYRFPLFEYTKTQMEEEAKEDNFSDIMYHTWFCYTPIKGKPCGICNPCSYSIEEKMEHRFSKIALIRNRYKLPFKVIRKIKRVFSDS